MSIGLAKIKVNRFLTYHRKFAQEKLTKISSLQMLSKFGAGSLWVGAYVGHCLIRVHAECKRCLRKEERSKNTCCLH